MADEPATAPKKTTRSKKASLSLDDFKTDPVTKTGTLYANLEALIDQLTETKFEIDKLDREISQTKKDWQNEQKFHEQELLQRNQAEEITRRRDQETYDYEISLARKKLKDELETRRQEIENDKRELADLRKQVESFTSEKDRAIREAVVATQKDLTGQFEAEKKLRDQEVKSQIEVLNLRIAALESDNSRQTKETDSLKKSLDEATRQIKDIAIQVIQSKRPETSTTN